MAENTRELKRRMRSIESTEHITNAMRLVSAAKFRKAKSLFDQKSLQLRGFARPVLYLIQGKMLCQRRKKFFSVCEGGRTWHRICKVYPLPKIFCK